MAMPARLSFAILLVVFASSAISALTIEVSTYRFKAEKSYAEVYLRLSGNTIQWTKKAGKLYASAAGTLIFKDSIGNIVAFDKFRIDSPASDSISDILVLRRVTIPDQLIFLNVEVEDESEALNKIQLEQKIPAVPSAEITISDMMPLGTVHKEGGTDNTLVKSGIYMEPLPYHFINEKRVTLDAYVELYGLNACTEPRFLSYYLLPLAKDVSKTAAPPPLPKVKKLGSAAIKPMILLLPTKPYRSGEYKMVVEIIDSAKHVIASKFCFLTISNPAADLAVLEEYNDNVQNSFVQNLPEEDLKYILRAHVPIVDQVESSTLEFLILSDKPISRRHFIYNYWKKRSASNPEAGFNAYMEVAKAVDKKFNSNAGAGFQTDRGHIFLKHGKPTNVVTVDTEVDAPPYEIWYYNQTPTTKQTNVRFIFYNPSLAHNDFELLHSTCLGERLNLNWEKVLYDVKGKPENGESGAVSNSSQIFNRNAMRYFNDF